MNCGFLKSLFDSLPVDQNCPVVILGDFNVDFQKSKEPRDVNIPGRTLKQLIEVPTTNYGSTLDNIYTDLSRDAFSYGVFESYFSDHKPIWIKIKH